MRDYVRNNVFMEKKSILCDSDANINQCSQRLSSKNPEQILKWVAIYTLEEVRKSVGTTVRGDKIPQLSVRY